MLSYLALRERDLSDLQLRLTEQGLSSLDRLESHVIVSIEKVIKNLGLSLQNGVSAKRVNELNDLEEISTLAENIEQAFYRGYTSALSTDRKLKSYNNNRPVA